MITYQGVWRTSRPVSFSPRLHFVIYLLPALSVISESIPEVLGISHPSQPGR